MSARHDFDVVVIGSGAGGLNAAAYLARPLVVSRGLVVSVR